MPFNFIFYQSDAEFTREFSLFGQDFLDFAMELLEALDVLLAMCTAFEGVSFRLIL